MEFFNLKNKFIKNITFLFSILFVLVSLYSCNMFESIADDISDEAKYEQALILIDEGKYDEAKVLLGQLTKDEEITVLLASCNSGKVIDLASLISAVNIEEGEDVDPLKALGTILGSSDGVVNSTDLATNRAALEESIEQWGEIKEGSEYYEEAQVQLAVVSLTHAVVTISEVIIGEIPGDTLELTQEKIEEAFSGDELKDALTSATFEEDNSSVMESLITDINNLASTSAKAEEIGLTDDMQDGFNDFLNDIRPTTSPNYHAISSDYPVTDAELAAFFQGETPPAP